MTLLDPGETITDYHAHVYYDAASKEAAARLRAAAEARYGAAAGVRFGRWHDNPVGPHPTASYQIAFPPSLFADLVPWLALNRGGLTVFVHPNTGNDLEDHRDRAIWLGESQKLDLSVL
jgi:aromatic ring-cleaving dioxygenase